MLWFLYFGYHSDTSHELICSLVSGGNSSNIGLIGGSIGTRSFDVREKEREDRKQLTMM